MNDPVGQMFERKRQQRDARRTTFWFMVLGFAVAVAALVRTC